MSKMLKRSLSMLFVVALIASMLVIPAEAACKHEKRIEDECVKCGDMKEHVCKRWLPFIARYNGNDAPRSHKKALGSSKTANWYKAGERLWVVARTRRKNGNLWLKLSDGSYIWSEYAAFDFDASVDEAYNLANQALTPIGWYINMGVLFRANGAYDLKVVDLLGYREEYKQQYYVYSNGIVQDRKMSGEELGNILYGCLFARYGQPFTEAIHCASWADYHWFPSNEQEKAEKAKWDACWHDLEYSMCDDDNDRQLIALGYWIEEHRSSNSCVPWKYDVTSPI